MLHINRSATSGSNASTTTTNGAANGDRHTVSSPADNLYNLLTRKVDVSGNEAVQDNHQEAGDKALAEVVPAILRDLPDSVRNLPKWARPTLQVPVGDGHISISETHAGLEIEDDKSPACTIPDMDFDSFMHVLAQEVEDRPDLYGKKAVSLAAEITAHTLRGLPPELRRAITQRLESLDSAAMSCAGRSLDEDPSMKASVMESAGPKLMARDGLEGLKTAIDRILDLPGKFRLAPLLVLAKAISTLPVVDRLSAFNALSEAAGSLLPRDQSELFETLVVLAKAPRFLPYDSDRQTFWRQCFEQITGQLKPEDQGRALVGLAASFADCLSRSDRQGAVEEILSAVAKFDANDGYKGYVLGQVLLRLSRLPKDYQSTALKAMLPLVTELDDLNVEKGWALCMLAKQGKHVHPLNSAFIASVLESALKLPRGDKEKGEALAAIAEYSYHCFWGDMRKETFSVILHALDEIDDAEAGKRNGLYWLSSCVSRLPDADKAGAITALMQAIAGNSQDRMTIVGLANAMAAVPAPMLEPEAFRVLLQTVSELDIKFNERGSALIRLANSVGRLPEAERLAAFESVQKTVATMDPGDGMTGMSLIELLKVIPSLPDMDAPSAFNALLPMVRQSYPELVLGDHDEEEDPEELQAELYSCLQDTINQLPPEYQADAFEATTGW